MADGKLLAEEKSFFEDKVNEFGFPIHTIQEMLDTPLDEIKKLDSTDIDNIDFITDIVAMAMVDNELHESEYQLCIDLAQKKKISKQEIDSTINSLKKLIKNV